MLKLAPINGDKLQLFYKGQVLVEAFMRFPLVSLSPRGSMLFIFKAVESPARVLVHNAQRKIHTGRFPPSCVKEKTELASVEPWGNSKD